MAAPIISVWQNTEDKYGTKKDCAVSAYETITPSNSDTQIGSDISQNNGQTTDNSGTYHFRKKTDNKLLSSNDTVYSHVLFIWNNYGNTTDISALQKPVISLIPNTNTSTNTKSLGTVETFKYFNFYINDKEIPFTNKNSTGQITLDTGTEANFAIKNSSGSIEKIQIPIWPYFKKDDYISAQYSDIKGLPDQSPPESLAAFPLNQTDKTVQYTKLQIKLELGSDLEAGTYAYTLQISGIYT